MKKLLVIWVAILAAWAHCAPVDESVRIKGVLTVAAGDFAVIATPGRVNGRGTLVRFVDGATGVDGLHAGDDVILTGMRRNGEIVCGGAIRRGHVPDLESPPLVKGSDLRKGLVHLYRTRLVGTLARMEKSIGEGGKTNTLLNVVYENMVRPVCFHGDLPCDGLEKGATIEVIGVARSTFDAQGNAIGTQIDVSEADDITVLTAAPKEWWLLLAWGSTAMLAAVSVALLVAWIGARRERMRLEIVTDERKRIAAELHDTLEQHFAGAKILIAGALRLKDVGEGAAGLLRQAMDVLANAKVEVRDAVMGFRDDLEGSRTLEQELVNLAKSASLKGVANVRTKFVRFSPPSRPGIIHDIVSIVREAVTNAVKHGKAKNIAIVADGRILRILNDGEKFDPDRILGPETGHCGVSGMRERAARSGLELEFVNEDRWCGIKLGIRNSL